MRFQKCTLFLAGFFLYAVPAIVAVFVLLSWSIPTGTYAQQSGPEAASQERQPSLQDSASTQSGGRIASEHVTAAPQDVHSASQDLPVMLPEVAAVLRTVDLSPRADEFVLHGSDAMPISRDARLNKLKGRPQEDAFPPQRAANIVADARLIKPRDVGWRSTSNNEGFSALEHWTDLERLSLEMDRGNVLSMSDAEMELPWPREPEEYSLAQDPGRFWKWPLQDALALAKGFASQGAVMAAGGGAVLFVAGRHDQELTAEMSNLSPEPAQLLVKVVEEFGNVRAVRPLAAAVFLGTLMTDDLHLQDAAFTSLEAVILANLATSGLKTMFGRARPYQNEGAFEFRPFSGNTSFPSGHATTAFALVTPWLLYYPSALTPGLIVLSTGTAFTRMLTDNHWFTDVVAGSAIGFATAYLLSKRHQDAVSRIRLTPSVSPDQVGISLAVKMP